MQIQKRKGATAMKEILIAFYKRLSAAHKYALGFILNGNLYIVLLTFDELATYFKLDRASSERGGFAKIRIKLSAAQRQELAKKAELLGTAELLKKDPHHNKGENLERELTERWLCKEWHKDNTPFWVAGDIRLGNEEIQVKLDGAELTNERAYRRLG